MPAITLSEQAAIDKAAAQARKQGYAVNIRLGGHDVLVDGSGHAIDLTTGMAYKAQPAQPPMPTQAPTRPLAAPPGLFQPTSPRPWTSAEWAWMWANNTGYLRDMNTGYWYYRENRNQNWRRVQ